MPTFPIQPAGQSPAPIQPPAPTASAGQTQSAGSAAPSPASPGLGSASGEQRQLTFTSSQAARYLGVSLATIRRWTDAGHVACYRTPGGQRRFSKDQLDGFIASLQDAQGHPSRRAA
jgi:excisionase family DNA binding protein